MKKQLTVFLLVFAIITAPSLVFAQSPWAQETGYANQITQKAIFGLKNVLFGWTEVFTETLEGDDPIQGAADGIIYAIANTAGGAAHLATFPCTHFDIALPRGGVFPEG